MRAPVIVEEDITSQFVLEQHGVLAGKTGMLHVHEAFGQIGGCIGDLPPDGQEIGRRKVESADLNTVFDHFKPDWCSWGSIARRLKVGGKRRHSIITLLDRHLVEKERLILIFGDLWCLVTTTIVLWLFFLNYSELRLREAVHVYIIFK